MFPVAHLQLDAARLTGSGAETSEFSREAPIGTNRPTNTHEVHTAWGRPISGNV